MEHDAIRSAAGALRPVPVPEDVPLELCMGDEVIEVRFDARGIHFAQREGSGTVGFLPWDKAIALSLLPGP